MQFAKSAVLPTSQSNDSHYTWLSTRCWVSRHMVIRIFLYWGPQMCDVQYDNVYFVIMSVLLTVWRRSEQLNLNDDFLIFWWPSQCANNKMHPTANAVCYFPVSTYIWWQKPGLWSRHNAPHLSLLQVRVHSNYYSFLWENVQLKEIEIQKLYEKATVNMDQQSFLLRCYTDTICTCTGEASDSS